MELRHIRYFIAAAEEEHFGRASDRLFVTRPAVSQIIADLEQELGTPLFDRLAHRVRLTAAGRALLPQLQGVMTSLGDALTMAKRVGQGKSGTLKIGYGSLTLMHSLFKEAVKQFHELYPDVVLSLIEVPTNHQFRALGEGRIQGGFMHFGPRTAALRKRRDDDAQAPDEPALEWVRIQSGGIGVAMPKGHRLARKKSLTLAELAEEFFVIVPYGSVTPGWGPLYALCQKAGFEPKVAQEVTRTVTQLNLISVGMGIGLVALGKNFLYPTDIAVVPLEQVNYSTSFVFAWVKGQRDPALDRMIEIVKERTKQ